MAEPRLELRQGQSLVMTQQLRQSIGLLQLSTYELNTIIEEELEKNPLLTREEDAQKPDSSAHEANATEGNEQSAQEVVGESAEGATIVSDSEAASKLDADEGEFWGEAEDGLRYKNHDGAQSMRGSGCLNDDIEQRLSSEKTLHETVLEQVRLMNIASIVEQKSAEAIVDMIDGAGYLPIDALERALQFGIDEESFHRIVGYIHQCEPTGVGARSLGECLALQLQEKGLCNAAMQCLLDNLELVAQAKFKRLAKICDVSHETLMEMLPLIKACDPKPGGRYDTHTAETLIPEVIVRKGQHDDWIVELNAEVLPNVLLDQHYSNNLKNRTRDKDDIKVINEHMANANWLMRAIHQRNTSLLEIATEIVKQQQDFFDFGIQYLKPMTLKDVAVEVGCHESTVSRITTSKYLMCERGTFELKYFFTSTLTNSNGGMAYSSRTVMHMIKTIIDGEAPDAVLSDDAITEQLNKRGISVARRTVVKYRKQMSIPSSVQRRRSKNI